MTPIASISAHHIAQATMPTQKSIEKAQNPTTFTPQRQRARRTVQTILPNMLTSAPCMSLIDLPPPCNGIERTAMIPDNGGTWK
jgi:hypothetical protein